MRFIFLILALLPVLVTAQVCDDFESGTTGSWSFNEPGRWMADTSAAIGGMFSLHHVFDNPSSGEDIAVMNLDGLSPDLGVTRWDFRIRHGYNPSSSNNWGVILLADLDPARETSWEYLSGFILGVNITGYDDSVRIWKVRNGEYSTVLTLPVDWQQDIGTDSSASFSVERSADGEWTAGVTIEGIERSSSVSEPYMPMVSNYFGLTYRYSANHDRQLWFDDFCLAGTFIADTIPPAILSARFRGNRNIEIAFSEPVSPATLDNHNIRLETDGSADIWPEKVTFIAERVIDVQFNDVFLNKSSYCIRFDTLTDIRGNYALHLEACLEYTFPETGDLIITEIMVSPSPSVSLPEVQYLEICNRSVYRFDFSSVVLWIDDKEYYPVSQFIEKGEYVIICSIDDSASLSPYGKTLSVPGSLSLSTSGGIIYLTDVSGNLIHGVEYSADWFNDILKNEGGWSFEMIDMDYPFSPSANWAYSTNRRGGSPVEPNSVSGYNPDFEGPSITDVFPTTPSSLEVSFSETIATSGPQPLIIDGSDIGITDIYFTDPLYRKAHVELSGNLDPGKIYTLSLKGDTRDMAGNISPGEWFRFGYPVEAGESDLLFNEVLFNPLPYKSEYIEFYNGSSKTLDASRLMMFAVNTETGDTGRVCPLSPVARCLIPGDYYAVTRDWADVATTYTDGDKERIFEVDCMPSLDNKSSTLVLCNRLTDLIDRFDYSEDMHNDMLSSVQGISLERKDPLRPTNEPGNWVSASSLSGWGTPGAPNSSLDYGAPDQAGIILSSDRVTPDGDGDHDILQISMLFKTDNMLVTAIIYSDGGVSIKTLARNETCSYEDKLVWDGTCDDGRPAASGIYIVFVKAIDKDGHTGVWKKVCALTRR